MGTGEVVGGEVGVCVIVGCKDRVGCEEILGTGDTLGDRLLTVKALVKRVYTRPSFGSMNISCSKRRPIDMKSETPSSPMKATIRSNLSSASSN